MWGPGRLWGFSFDVYKPHLQLNDCFMGFTNAMRLVDPLLPRLHVLI